MSIPPVPDLSSLLSVIAFTRPLKIEDLFYKACELKTQLLALPQFLQNYFVLPQKASSLKRIFKPLLFQKPINKPTFIMDAVSKSPSGCQKACINVGALVATALAGYSFFKLEESQLSAVTYLASQIAAQYFISKKFVDSTPYLKWTAHPLTQGTAFAISEAAPNSLKFIGILPILASAGIVLYSNLRTINDKALSTLNMKKNSAKAAIASLALLAFAYGSYQKLNAFSHQNAITETTDRYNNFYYSNYPPGFENPLHEVVTKHLKYLDDYRKPWSCWYESFQPINSGWRSFRLQEPIFFNSNRYIGELSTKEYKNENGEKITEKWLEVTNGEYQELKDHCRKAIEKNDFVIKNEHPIQRNIFTILDKFYDKVEAELEENFDMQRFERWRQGITELKIPLIFNNAEIESFKKKEQPEEKLEEYANTFFQRWMDRYNSWLEFQNKINSEKIPRRMEFEKWFMKPSKIIEPKYFDTFENVPIYSNSLTSEETPSADALHTWYQLHYDWWIKYSNKIESQFPLNDIHEFGLGPINAVDSCITMPPDDIENGVSDWEKRYEDWKFEKKFKTLSDEEQDRLRWERYKP